MAQRQGTRSPRRNESAMRISRRTVLKGAAIGTGALLFDRPGLALGQGAGFRTAVQSYVVPSLPDGVEITPILTVGDRAGNGYRMVGIPDGLGAMANGQTFTLLMNHELGGSSGVVRKHCSAGAFVSRGPLDRETLLVRAGEDLTPSPNFVYRWDPATKQYLQGTTVWERHCSADLPSESALCHGNIGTAERIYLN